MARWVSPGGGSMILSMSKSRITASHSSDSISGRIDQGVAHGFARFEVRRELAVFRMQPAEIDHPPHPGAAGGGHDVADGTAFLGGEILRGAHRTQQVVDDVNAVERRDQRIDITQVTARHLGPLSPRHVRQLLRVAGQCANVVTPVQQLRHQPGTDVAGRPGYQAVDLSSRHRISVPRLSVIRS